MRCWFPLLLLLAACGSVNTFADAAAGDDDAPAACASCDPNASCVSEACVCDSGFTGDGLTCTDVDECVDGNNGGCDPLATCQNTVGSRTCACPANHVGDGLSCRQVWEPVVAVPSTTLDGGQGAVTAGLGSSIYFAQENGLAGLYFKSVDVGTGAVTDRPMPPGTYNDFCACGYTQTFTTLGDAIYMFGNYGSMFTNGAWSDASYPDVWWRGEAAGAASSGAVYVIGGRDNATNSDTSLVQYYSGGATGSWTAASSYPWTSSRAGAYTPLGSTTLYVAGGYSGDGSRAHFASLDTSTPTGSWTILPDVPGDAGNYPSLGEYAGKLLLCNGQQIFVFDRGSSTWTGTVPMPALGTNWRLVMVAGTAYLIGDAADSVAVGRLLAIE